MKVQISNCKAKIEISARPIARACCSCQQYMFLQSEGMVLHRRLAQFFFNAVTHCISAYFVAAARAHTGPGHEWECQHCLHTHSPTPLSRLLFSPLPSSHTCPQSSLFSHIHLYTFAHISIYSFTFTFSHTLSHSYLPFSPSLPSSDTHPNLSFFHFFYFTVNENTFYFSHNIQAQSFPPKIVVGKFHLRIILPAVSQCTVKSVF